MTRRHRARIATAAVFCLLFQQLALAAYVCAMEAGPAEPPMTMADCHPPAATTPPDPLCHKHCAPDTTTAAEARTAGVPPLALPADSVLPLPLHARSLHGGPARHMPPSLHAPPPILAFARLLI